MCGRYVSATPVEQLAEYFAADPDPELLPDPASSDGDLPPVSRARYNIPPTEQVLGVVLDRRGGEAEGGGEGGGGAPRSGHRRIRAFRWGLVPPFAKDLSAGSRAFNARAETLATRPMFRGAFRQRRLLVPATAFYEWQKTGRARRPFLFERADGAPLAFAGLWERWRDPATGAWIRSLTIVTTDAGPDVAAVHDRQPVVIEPERFELWLDPAVRDPALVQPLLVPSPGGTLVARPVDPAVGSPANDSPELVRLFEP